MANYPYSKDIFAPNVDQGVEITAEAYVIPGSAPYQVTLNQYPQGPITQQDGSVLPTTLTIVGFTEITEGTPQPSQFICDYDTGVLTFNAADANMAIACDYQTAGDVVYAGDMNAVQDTMEAVEDDLLGAPRSLRAVVDSGETTLTIFGGSYSRGGVFHIYAGASEVSHGDWTTPGAYYVYIDSTDTLVLNGGSFPTSCIPICVLVTVASGEITGMEDSRILNSGAGGGGWSEVYIAQSDLMGDITAGVQADLANTTINIITHAGDKVYLSLHAQFISTVGWPLGLNIYFFVDGASVAERWTSFTSAIPDSPYTFDTWVVGLGAGAHIVKVQWAGPATIFIKNDGAIHRYYHACTVYR